MIWAILKCRAYFENQMLTWYVFICDRCLDFHYSIERPSWHVSPRNLNLRVLSALISECTWTSSLMFGAFNMGWQADSPYLWPQSWEPLPRVSLAVSALLGRASHALQHYTLRGSTTDWAAAWQMEWGSQLPHPRGGLMGAKKQIMNHSTGDVLRESKPYPLKNILWFQGTKFLYSILLQIAVLYSWDLYPFTVSYKISILSQVLLPQSRVFPCVYQTGSSLLVACSNKCIWSFPASFSVLITTTMVWIKMPVPSFIAPEGRKIFLKAMISQWIGFSSSQRGRRRGWVQPSHVEHLLFFLPVAMATESLAGLALRGAQWHSVPGQQERGLGRDRGSILILMINGHCLLLVNFQKINHKVTTSVSVRCNHCFPIIQLWGLQILQYKLPTTYSETVIGKHRILINVSGLLYLKLVLFVIRVPCSNKQQEFHHLQFFNPISVMVSKSCSTGMSQRKKIAYSCRNLQGNELFQNNELLTHGTTAEALQWCQPLVCQ